MKHHLKNREYGIRFVAYYHIYCNKLQNMWKQLIFAEWSYTIFDTKIKLIVTFHSISWQITQNLACKDGLYILLQAFVVFFLNRNISLINFSTLPLLCLYHVITIWVYYGVRVKHSCCSMSCIFTMSYVL